MFQEKLTRARGTEYVQRATHEKNVCGKRSGSCQKFSKKSVKQRLQIKIILITKQNLNVTRQKYKKSRYQKTRQIWFTVGTVH